MPKSWDISCQAVPQALAPPHLSWLLGRLCAVQLTPRGEGMRNQHSSPRCDPPRTSCAVSLYEQAEQDEHRARSCSRETHGAVRLCCVGNYGPGTGRCRPQGQKVSATFAGVKLCAGARRPGPVLAGVRTRHEVCAREDPVLMLAHTAVSTSSMDDCFVCQSSCRTILEGPHPNRGVGWTRRVGLEVQQERICRMTCSAGWLSGPRQ